MGELVGGPQGAVETTGPGGRPMRAFRISLSAEALALAWARQENAPNGATVLVEQEVSPRGRVGRLWPVAPGNTLTLAIVLRPPVPSDEADVVWLAGGVAAAAGAAALCGKELNTWWPDQVIETTDGDRAEVAMVKAEVQLGPGQVRSAVVTLRIDLTRLGLDAERRGDLVEAVLAEFDQVSDDLAEDAGAVAAAYEGRCRLIGQKVKVTLLPKGESRGIVRAVDRMGRLQLESATGMVERLTINQLRDLEVV